MTNLKELFKKTSHYTVAKFAIMAAGFVSYPILTRALHPHEYGIMGITVALLNIFVGIAKMGMGTSIVRLWPEWEKKDGGVSKFVLTIFISIILISLPLIILFDLGTYLLSSRIEKYLAFFFLLASPLILTRALNSYGLALLQAREWSKARAFFEVLTSYAAMILSVIGATVLIGNLLGYYVGLIVGEAAVSAILVFYVLRGVRLRRASFSRPLLFEAISFGFPIALYELSGVLLYSGDRFIIMSLLGETAVGYYTVAFNLVQYIHVIFTVPIVMAVGPMVAKLCEKEGTEAASIFLRKVARFFFLFALPALTGLTVIRGDLVAVLASEQFLPGASLVHILLASFLLAGSRDIFCLGMFLKKRTWLLAQINLAGAGLNLILNFILIPYYGLNGAAYATLLSQLVITIVAWRMSARLVPISLDILAFMKHALAALAMATAIYYLVPEHRAVRLATRLFAGLSIYGIILLFIDGNVRNMAKKVVNGLRKN